MSLDLINPPIVEFSCGVFFSAHENITPVAIGDFWSKVKVELPQHSLYAPMPQPGVKNQYRVTIGSAKASDVLVRFNSSDNEHVIQIQKNSFHYNWCKQTSSYPGASECVERFKKYFDLFKSYLCSLAPEVKLEISQVRCLKLNAIEAQNLDFLKFSSVVDFLATNNVEFKWSSSKEGITCEGLFVQSQEPGTFILQCDSFKAADKSDTSEVIKEIQAVSDFANDNFKLILKDGAFQ